MKRTLQTLFFALIAMMMPIGTWAQVTDAIVKVGDTEYADFAEALANWTDGTTLTLLADVTGRTERIKTYAKGLILDLNGHKIECSDNWTIWIDGEAGSELTIRDSKGDGYIQGTVYAVAGGSTLRLESGTVEEVTANGDFTMTGGKIINEYSHQALYVNSNVDIVISGGEISGKVGIQSDYAGNITVTGTAKITATNGYAIDSRYLTETIIDGTPTLSGTKGELSTEKAITFNTQPADGIVWRVAIDAYYNKDGIFAIPGEGVTLDISKFASAMEGYEVKQNAKGELLLCDHKTAHAAISNGDGHTHKTLCACGEAITEEQIECFGFGATCQDKAVCSACGQSYGETNPDVHTFDDDGKCGCGAERGEATTVDLSALTGTYVISDSEEYIFTGSGSYGIKVESGSPKIVLNNANITLADGDYYENNPINGIHIASTGGTTIIYVMGNNSITAKAGAGIFAAEGSTVKIIGNSREDVLTTSGAEGSSGIGGYVFINNNNDLVCCNSGNIEITNVTVKAFGSQSSLGDAAPAIGAAGNANCGYVTIDNAEVYAEGFISPHGYEGSSAIGTGADFITYQGGTIGEISIINNSNVYVTRGNYCDYIGISGHEAIPAEGIVNATAKSSAIYCYDASSESEPVQTLKYGALGTLLVEDEHGNWVCEGEHTYANGVCENCGYKCTHEGSEHTYTDNGDGTHSFTCSICGEEVTEVHSYTLTAESNMLTEVCACGHPNGTITIEAADKTYDGKAVEVVITKMGSLENADIAITYTKDGEAFTGEPIETGTYTVTITMEEKSASVEFTIVQANVEAAEIALEYDETVYDGTEKTPAVTAVVVDGVAIDPASYDVTYADNTAIGTATVTITFKGNYTGTVSTTFEILEDTADVDMTTVSGGQATVIYDLQGRRVEKGTKGIYIVNGKKVVIK